MLKQLIYNVVVPNGNLNNDNVNNSQIRFTQVYKSLPYITELTSELTNGVKSFNIKLVPRVVKTIGTLPSKIKDNTLKY